MGYSKHELNTINMLYSPKKIVMLHCTHTSPHGHLSTTASFFCPQGGRGGEVKLDLFNPP